MNTYSKQIYDKYQHAIKQRRTKIISIWFYIMLFSGVIAGVFYLFYDRAEIFQILFFSLLGVFGMFFIVVLMLLIFFVSEKPLYEILYPKIVDDHNYEESTFITYAPYPQDKDFFTFGGLYPTHSTKYIRFKLSFDNVHGYHVDVYDAYVSTSNGKSTNVHLNGYYLILRDYSNLKFQLRTYGTPNVDPKYKRLNDIKNVRAFVEPEAFDIDPIYINLYNLIKNEYHSTSVTLGCNGNDLHVGITLRPMRRNVKVLNEDVYHEIRRSLMQMIDLANIIK